MAEEQAQNGAPDAPEAPTSDVENGAVKDTTPASDTPTPQTVPNEPLPQAEATPSEPAQPSEPIVIPPFDNSPAPLPPTEPTSQTPASSGAPAPSPAPAGRSGRDLLVKALQTIQQRKQKKLEKILDLFAKQEKITNDEVEKLLHVSDATATRYLSELEKQGKVKQVGKTGHAVSYTKI